jgi:magnesium transporter
LTNCDLVCHNYSMNGETTNTNITQSNASSNPRIVYIGQDEFLPTKITSDLSKYDITELDTEDVLSDTQLSKIEFRPDYIYIALQFPEFDKLKRTFIEKEVHCFVNKDYLIIINKHGFQGVESFRNINNMDIDRNTTFDLFYEMLWKGLNSSYRAMLKLKIEVHQLNEQIFDDQKGDKDFIFDIQTTKRNIVNFEGIVEPLSEVLQSIEIRYHRLVDIEDKEQVDDCLDLIKKILNNINILKQQIQIISETNEAVIARSTNEVVKRLTGISILVLVPSTITGFFSMNMYYGFSPNASWPTIVVITTVLLLTTIVYFVLRKKNWI